MVLFCYNTFLGVKFFRVADRNVSQTGRECPVTLFQSSAVVGTPAKDCALHSHAAPVASHSKPFLTMGSSRLRRPHSSRKSFCRGVPVSSRRRRHGNSRISLASLVCCSFTRCASSTTKYYQFTCAQPQQNSGKLCASSTERNPFPVGWPACKLAPLIRGTAFPRAAPPACTRYIPGQSYG